MMSRVVVLARLAALDLVRQRRRASFALLITVFGLVAVLVTRAWQLGMFELMEREGTSVWLGPVQVIPAGTLEVRNALALEPNLPAQGPLIEEIRKVRGVTTVSPRIRFFGRLFRGDANAPVIALGYDATTVGHVLPRMFDEARLDSGRLPDFAKEDEVLIASPLAAALALKPGDVVTILARPANGGLEGVDLRVAGIFKAAFQENQRRAVLVDGRVVSRLLRMEGRATELLVGVEPVSRAGEVADALEERLATLEKVEVRPWDELNPGYKAALKVWRTSLLVMLVAVIAVAILGLATTLVLIVQERSREVATLAALGLRRWALVLLFVFEGAWLGLAGGIFGVGLGSAIVGWLGARGVGFTAPGGFPVTVRPYLTSSDALTALVVISCLAATIGAVPAWRAARRQPSDLLR